MRRDRTSNGNRKRFLVDCVEWAPDEQMEQEILYKYTHEAEKRSSVTLWARGFQTGRPVAQSTPAIA